MKRPDGENAVGRILQNAKSERFKWKEAKSDQDCDGLFK